jgi:YebC/PmpR family DNA-binding regulatory protein
MAGHSHWANIQHKKARVDAKRGKAWTKAARLIVVAAREGGGDPDANSSLRLAIEKARAANMPKDTIDRSIKKGTGELAGEDLEEITYEGYGPNGVAVLAKALTDNRNRTAPEIKKIFERAGGNLGQPNCVSWMFSQKGLLIVSSQSATEEQLMEVALEAGAEDIETMDGAFQITAEPASFQAVKQALDDAEIVCDSADLAMLPSNSVRLDGADQAQKILKLMESLDDHDDIQSVSANFDIPNDVMAQLSN